MRTLAVLTAVLAGILPGAGDAAAEKLTKDTTVTSTKGGVDPCAGGKTKTACKNEQQTRDLIMQRTSSQHLKATPSTSGSSGAAGR